MDMIREQSGDVTAGAVHSLVRVSLWLSGGPFELMVRNVPSPTTSTSEWPFGPFIPLAPE